MQFIITVKEVWDQLVKVEAENKEDAIQAIKDGNGIYLDNPEYSRSLDSDGWTIEENTNG